MEQKTVKIGNIEVSNNNPFVLFSGPCQMESRDHAMMTAEFIKTKAENLGIPLVYKTSFDKANRTSVGSKRGLGLDKALRVFEEVKSTFNLPTLTDIHEKEQCDVVASVVDVIQIPAFLCRQTDLLVAAGQAAAKHNATVKIKKGQFLAPWDMQNVVKKVESTNCEKIMLTDRGTSFGYNTLVSDMRGLPIMAETTGYPVIYDATHSVQSPGGQGGTSGGDRRFVQSLASAAIAVGVAGVFMESHQDPDNAPSDGPCMVKFDDLEKLLARLKAIDEITKK